MCQMSYAKVRWTKNKSTITEISLSVIYARRLKNYIL